MLVLIIPPRRDCLAFAVTIQRGLVAAFASPHPFAPVSAHLWPRLKSTDERRPVVH